MHQTAKVFINQYSSRPILNEHSKFNNTTIYISNHHSTEYLFPVFIPTVPVQVDSTDTERKTIIQLMNPGQIVSDNNTF